MEDDLEKLTAHVMTLPKFLLALGIPLLGCCWISSPAVAQNTPPIWSAPASTIVISEERQFQNGDTQLSGSLPLPKGSGSGNNLGGIVNGNWTY